MLNPGEPAIPPVAVVQTHTAEAEQLALAFHAEQTNRVARRLLGLLYGAGDEEAPPTRAA